MDQRTVVRYSSSFKLHVIRELEEGKFSNIAEAMRHYGITGCETIKGWLKRYGKDHLRARVVRVERPDEMNEIQKLRREIKQLKQALGHTQAEKVLEQEFLNIACEKMGEDVNEFKKKAGMKLFTDQQKNKKEK